MQVCVCVGSVTTDVVAATDARRFHPCVDLERPTAVFTSLSTVVVTIILFHTIEYKLNSEIIPILQPHAEFLAITDEAIA